MELTPIDAERIAERAHQGQVDKASRPYIDHPRRVAYSVARHGALAYMAGMLHDVVEDTPVTLEDLRERGASEDLIKVVDALTHRKNEPREDYYKRVLDAGEIARLVKIADVRDNLNRLGGLDEETRTRLRKKYERALEVLGGEHE